MTFLTTSEGQAVPPVAFVIQRNIKHLMRNAVMFHYLGTDSIHLFQYVSNVTDLLAALKWCV
jgi:hypothetical protein